MDRRLIWLGLGAFATSTAAFSFAGLLPLIASSLNVTTAEAGRLLTAFSLTYAILTPVLSALLGAIGRRMVITLGLGLFILGNLLAAASPSYGWLMGAQVIGGMAAGLYAATAQGVAVSLAGPEHRAQAVSIVLAGTTMSVALGGPLGALIGNLAGWRASFLFVGGLAAFCLVVLWMRLPAGLVGSRLSLSERLTVIGRPGVLPMLLVTFLHLTGGFGVVGYLGPIAIEGAGLPVTVLPALLLIFGVGAVAGNLLSGRLADRLGATRIVAFAMCCNIGFFLLLTAMLLFLPQNIAGPAMLALMLPWGLIGWTFPPAQASRLVGLAPTLANLTLPLNVSALYLGIAAGSFLGGQALHFVPAAELPLVAIIFPLLGLAVLAATRKTAQLAAG